MWVMKPRDHEAGARRAAPSTALSSVFVKAPGECLTTDRLEAARRDLGHRLDERAVGCEDGRAGRLLVPDVDDRQRRVSRQASTSVAQLAEHERPVGDAQRAPSRRSTRAARRSSAAPACSRFELAHANALRIWRTPTMAAAVSAMPSARRLATRRSTRATADGPLGQEALDGLVHGRAAAGHEHLLGELAARRVQLVAHGGERPALPARLGRDLAELVLEPVEVELLAEREERVRRLGQRAARSRARRRSRRARRSARGARRRHRPAASGTPRSASASRRSAWSARQASLPTPRSVWESSLNEARSRAITPAASPSLACCRYQRETPSTRPSTPPMTSICTSVSTAGSSNSASTSSQRADRARDLARDPVGAHDLGGLGARLGHHLPGPGDAERVDDVVGHERGHDLAPQAVLAVELAGGLDDAPREVGAQDRRRAPGRPGSRRRAPWDRGCAWRRPAARRAPGASARGPGAGDRRARRWRAAPRARDRAGPRARARAAASRAPRRAAAPSPAPG